jgi:hypothetical protein
MTLNHDYIFLIFPGNWFKEDDVYVLCGNASGGGKCPPGYVCWKDRGIK